MASAKDLIRRQLGVLHSGDITALERALRAWLDL